jgi:uncharacterized protein (UPF0248 family)
MAFQTLNRLRWEGGIEGCEVIIRHRGAPGDVKAVECCHIRDVKKTYFTYGSGERETRIPNHRIIEIREGGKSLWRRSTARG